MTINYYAFLWWACSLLCLHSCRCESSGKLLQKHGALWLHVFHSHETSRTFIEKKKKSAEVYGKLIDDRSSRKFALMEMHQS